VKVTDWPNVLGFFDEITVVVVLLPVTVSVAVAVFPVPPFADVTVTELFFTPVVVAVTLTENVQGSLGVTTAPDKPTEFDPGVAAMMPHCRQDL
jgi:hypothetical protein